jgi:Na+/glutamate symporter
MHTDGGQFFGLIYGGTMGGIIGIVVSLGVAFREVRFERRRFEGLSLVIFFSVGLAELIALYDQIGPTVWLYAIVAGLFLIGFIGATIDEIQWRRCRKGRTKTRELQDG